MILIKHLYLAQQKANVSLHYTNTDNSQQQSLKTPIEIALGIDEDGKTTARKLYEFLGLAKGQFSRWAKTNITGNPYSENGVDYERFDIDIEGNKTVDYRLSANFAKKLSMQGKTEHAEQARDYFIKIENKSIETVQNELIVKDVDLFGDTVVAAQDKDGVIWAGVKWFCDGLGLSKGQMQSERKKIQEDLVLSKGERNFILPTKGGSQEVLCLQLNYIPLWLAKISITPTMKKNNPVFTL